MGRHDLVPERSRDKRCGSCYSGHQHTWAAHYLQIKHFKKAEARRNAHWICLCGRVQVPELEWCPGCSCKRHQGADILATVVDGLYHETMRGIPEGSE